MAKKKASTFLNMTITLVVITVVAGIALGAMNDLTIEPKARAKLEKKTAALQSVLSSYDNDPIASSWMVVAPQARDSMEVFPARLGQTVSGMAIVSSSDKGYSGTVKLMVGFNPDGTINDIVVLEQKETPGLGTKMKDDAFIDQFRGKDPANFDLRVKKDQGEVDALTGATISTRAFTQAVQQAHDVYTEEQANIKN